MTQEPPKTLQELVERIEEHLGIEHDFFEASNHPYDCRCQKCLNWWVDMGPDEDDSFGPFTKEEIVARAKERGVKVGEEWENQP